MKERTYSKDEIAALLERAAELHAQSAKSTNNKPGLTLSEIEEIATESGIDPLLIRQAATEMSGAPKASRLQTKNRNATHNFVERIIPGTLHPDLWEDIVMELRHRFDSDMGKMMGTPEYGVSTTEQIGRSVEWKHTSMSGIETRVLIRPRGNKLHLRIGQRVGWGSTLAESITYGAVLAFLVAGIAGGVTDSGLIGIITIIATLAAAIPLIHWADTAWRKKKHREIDSLADRISNMLILSENEYDAEEEAIPLEDYTRDKNDEKVIDLEEDTLDGSESGPQKKNIVRNTSGS